MEEALEPDGEETKKRKGFLKKLFGEETAAILLRIITSESKGYSSVGNCVKKSSMGILPMPAWTTPKSFKVTLRQWPDRAPLSHSYPSESPPPKGTGRMPMRPPTAIPPDLFPFGNPKSSCRGLSLRLREPAQFSMDLRGFANVMLHGILEGGEPDVFGRFRGVAHRFVVEAEVKMGVTEVIALAVR